MMEATVPVENLALFLFVFIIYIIAYLLKYCRGNQLARYGIDIDNLAIIIRTEKLNSLITKIGRGYARFWKIISTIGIFTGFYLMAIGLVFIHQNLISLLFRKTTASPVTPLIPGVTIGVGTLPYFIIAFILVLIPHEFFHGFVASSEKIDIKSSGLFFFLLFLGGFVEPDEDMFNKSSLLTKLRVFSAGSFANFLTYLIILFLFTLFVHPTGVLVTSTLPNYPAYGTLEKGDIILYLNDTRISSVEALTSFMYNTRPGDKVIVTIKRNNSIKRLILVLKSHPKNPQKGFMGVGLDNYYENRFLYYAFWWSLVITSSVAVINMLPIVPFDGGQIIANILASIFFKNKLKKSLAYKVAYAISVYVGIILILNIVLSFKIWGMKVLRFYP